MVRVTPQGAGRALRALHCAQRADNLRIEIAAARVLDAYCQGRLVAAEDITDAEAFLSERTSGLRVRGETKRSHPWLRRPAPRR